ncbi:bacteriohopanetetrol glucosamine biosynthesis glycosyltransferase HpnI [Paracidobacterium acidisoli]|uniref:Glycosyl transferase n=1 Tax=Paracidobacterium acidisoli TaxID=2303751 RepID=A0A372ILZ0_9BACT|nr:bacteriohopanetetrol glucosamine biosynthesis glycosyltransferase HpnI [Paracidobacterium acidisoli]MBT9332517.1 bacteriohopanetetrol glucosamine biosynthesis glycosyltransferase HpnI [Paracidobacterium acidisoli]
MYFFATAVETVTLLFTLAGLGYFLTALWASRAFLRRSSQTVPDFAPGVSILKPVKGLDPEMYEAFASHCRQQYAGEYEILFGVSSLDDPAMPAVRRLEAEFPEHSIRLIVCPEVLGANGKVSNLTQMLPHARHDYVVINDSDIRVGPSYLTRILATFGAASGREPVGMVTAPYRGRAHGTLGSKIEALGISTDFMPGVFTALLLDGEIRFGLGSTLACSRAALEAAGGLAPLADYLADDYQLGRRIAEAGFSVQLSDEVVETSVPAYRFRQFLDHQLRWARGVRDSRRWGYAGLAFSYGLAWALLNLIASGANLPSIALLCLALPTRVLVALSVGTGLLNDRQVLRDLWLLPVRDLLALGIWAWSFAAHTVVWRGEVFELRNGKLNRLREKTTAEQPAV